jgi:hypothetical protein
MAKGDCFTGSGKITTSLAQPLEDLGFAQHLGNNSGVG